MSTQLVPRGTIQSAANGDTTAGMFRMQLSNVERLDRIGSFTVEPASGGIVVLVAQVGTDHDERLVATRDGLEDLTDLLRRGLRHDEEDELVVSKHALQVRQMNFPSMFQQISGVERLNLRKREGFGDCFHVNGDDSQRGLESFLSRRCQPFRQNL